ncbi:MAG: threonine ammonia-lyase, biosynthetic [Thioalkalivibrionaceae bacterium]
MRFEYLEEILKAPVYDVAVESPLARMTTLSERLGHTVLLKREDLQPVFSFKLRGAYNRMVQLTPDERMRGVVAASAGNHAQGVALAARHLAVPARIVMPVTTPPIKVAAVRRFGGEAILVGDSFDDAQTFALDLCEREGLTFIPPFDDPYVIAGQGTVAMELLRQYTGPLDAVFVCVGGGGLLAGMGAYIKRLRPEVKVIGVEPHDAPSMYEALKANRRVRLRQVGIFADGAAVREVGRETFRVAREVCDEVMLVDTDAICAAIKDIFDDTRVLAEPAGALAVAGVKQYVERLRASEGAGVRPRHFAAVLSGANINFDRLRHVAERTEIGERREALFAVEIPERPGSFLRFCEILGRRSITEFNYRYADAARAQVFAGIQLVDGDRERLALAESLGAQGFDVLDLTDNELAKLHLRHLVGGHAPAVTDERLFRFEFPERPGALLEFLTTLGSNYNISLFHYRNHGSAYGRVLIGVQVPEGEHRAFLRALKNTGLVFWDEQDNPAYARFLR